jgi:hypothetical protein
MVGEINKIHHCSVKDDDDDKHDYDPNVECSDIEGVTECH